MQEINNHTKKKPGYGNEQDANPLFKPQNQRGAQ